MTAVALSPNPGAGLAVDATALRFDQRATSPDAVKPRLERRTLFRTKPADALVEIRAAAVNPSDVKAAIGLMPYAVFPRTPGRDFAGIVIDGPSDWLGKAVYGSSGDLGIRRDGTHATHLVVEADALVEKPEGISLQEAAGIGVPFVTAIEGFRRAGLPRPGETVLVLGVNGKVGQAAAQIATWRGARVIGVVRKAEPYAGHASGPVTLINSSAQEVASTVKELTDGRGADIVFNTVGDPYYAEGTASLAKTGRQIFIAAVNRIVEFDIFAFYRGRHTYVGIDTLALSSIETADVLRELAPGFAGGQLRPFPITADGVFALRDAAEAYARVSGSARDRVILVPGA
ncbi:zinc-binding alcohol dehydrogenase family protein [Xanthobacter sp. V7C-4]|uniref:quinone oxidoreductase family protein n=1 Tax=Xanthobacter autotrophicus (strain ATCC BAA-1158 / Py2) TaxID=78245 RepID=UPI00372BB791